MNDEELTARAREVGDRLSRRPGDLDRLAGALLTELADRLDVSYPAAAMAEVRSLLDANTARHQAHLAAGSDESVLRAVRAERLVIIDRLIALAAAGARAPKAETWDFCRRCVAGTGSVPCPRCGGPSCSVCRRCPPCDGDLPGEEDDGDDMEDPKYVHHLRDPKGDEDGSWLSPPGMIFPGPVGRPPRSAPCIGIP